jgi:hypothetical protein
MRTRQDTIFETVAQQDEEISGLRVEALTQFQELAEVRHELSEVHDRLDILVLRVNKRNQRHAADQAIIEELRVDKQEMIDVNKRLDYLVEFVNIQKRIHDRHTHDK